MPIYEYECSSCHHQFNVLQKVSDSPIKICPQCDKHEVKRLISAAGFQLKGTGWYATDFKNKDKKGNVENTVSKSDNKESTQSNETTSQSTSENEKKSSQTTIKKETQEN